MSRFEHGAAGAAQWPELLGPGHCASLVMSYREVVDSQVPRRYFRREVCERLLAAAEAAHRDLPRGPPAASAAPFASGGFNRHQFDVIGESGTPNEMFRVEPMGYRQRRGAGSAEGSWRGKS